MRVRDLLSMNTGHHNEDLLKFAFDGTNEPLTRAFLSLPVAHKPGTHFLYNTPATYMCSAIVQKKTGMTVLDYLKPRLFEPLGIQRPTWSMSPQGINHGGYGLNVTTEDIAKFGQLYLQKGKWNGKQLIPESWVAAATARQTSNGSNPASDWDQGYGYQFWRCRNNAFRGDGAFGQYCVVMPDQDAVIVITSGLRDMQGVMDLIWLHLLPAMKNEALPANTEAQEKLNKRVASLMVRPQQGEVTVDMAAKVSKKKFNFPSNPQKIESLSIDFSNTREPLLNAQIGGKEYAVPCGSQAWKKGKFVHPSLGDQLAAGSGAWTSADTYSAKIVLYETPFHVTLRCRFEGDQLKLDTEYNVAFGARTLPQLVGAP
jgi:hypothetical protein